MEKIKMQLLADSLGISRVTVWKVINNRKGVSPKTQTLVRDALKKIQQGEQQSINHKRRAVNDRIKCISLVASRPNTSVFWMGIIDQIVNEASMRSIRLNYIPVDVMDISAGQLQAMLCPSQTDGIVVINLYNEELISLLAGIKLPKVFLDTTPEHDVNDLNGDIILLEGERTIEKITQSMIDGGCKQIGFIGDICYAKTNALRFKGFSTALAKNNLSLNPRYCMTGPIDRDRYREEIGEFIAQLETLPDAFVCASDYVAFIVYSLLNVDKGKTQCPQVSGYDHSQEFLLDHYGITTANVQNDLLGKRMAAQIFYRIENPHADFEEITITPKILFRS